MSQIVYRANLSSAFFPFISTLQGRTVIVGGQDNNFNRQVQSNSDLDKDIGIPQIYYCENVMPTEAGLQSIKYDELVSVGGNANLGIVKQFVIRDDFNNYTAHMFTTNTSTIYGLSPAYGSLVNYNVAIINYFFESDLSVPAGILPLNAGNLISTAHVSGITYICIKGFGIFRYDFVLGKLIALVLPGIAILAPAIVGITESNGYLIIFDKNTVYWSSTISATDFTPSLVTGAGSGRVEGIKGIITCASATSNGFVLYSTQNAVSVLYTANARYPFQFSEVVGSGGVSKLDYVTYEADSGYNYAYTTRGLQSIQSKIAQTVLSAVTDFISGEVMEYFDIPSATLSRVKTTKPLLKKLSIIASRYFIISYGEDKRALNSTGNPIGNENYTHALVYDIVQKRLGKLKILHVDCFEFALYDEQKKEIPKKSLCFVSNAGTIKTVNFDIQSDVGEGTLILGKYQYIRSRHLQLQEASFENIQPNKADILLLTSYDGKNTSSKIQAINLNQQENLKTVAFGSPVGLNHSIFIQGSFNLVSVELKFNIHGRQ
jgi:hypothetical protein